MGNIMTDKLGRNWSRIFQLFHGSTRKEESDVDTDQEVVSNYLGSLQSQAVSNESLRPDGVEMNDLSYVWPSRDEWTHGCWWRDCLCSFNFFCLHQNLFFKKFVAVFFLIILYRKEEG